MMKKNVRNRIPVFRINWAVFPHVPQRMSSEVRSEPQKNTLVPIMSMAGTGYQPMATQARSRFLVALGMTNVSFEGTLNSCHSEGALALRNLLSLADFGTLSAASLSRTRVPALHSAFPNSFPQFH